MLNKTNLNVEDLCSTLLSTVDDKSKQDKRNKKDYVKILSTLFKQQDCRNPLTKSAFSFTSEFNLSSQSSGFSLQHSDS